MSGELKSKWILPDFWYDFFGRLLPGMIFVYGVLLIRNGAFYMPAQDQWVFILFAGYISGFLLSPVSSFLVNRIDRGKSDEVASIQYKLDSRSSKAMLLSKMKAEIMFFSQLSLFSLFLLVIYAIMVPVNFSYFLWVLISILILSVISTFYYDRKRYRRAKSFQDILDQDQS